MTRAAGEILLRLRDWSLDRRDDDGARPLLAGLDLELRAGGWLAVTGGNGSGKSSLLKYLASPESPLDVPAALLCQDPDEQIVGGSVDRELTLGRDGLDAAAWRKEFGLEGLGDLDARILAAGQKQRLALATALAGAPRILLCDEPTSLQDEAQAAWVLDRLDRWRRESGGSLVTATCDRREAARADWLVVLGDGAVRAAGRPEDLLARPEVADLLVGSGDGEREAPPPRAAGAEGTVGPTLALDGVGCAFDGPTGGFAGLDLALWPGERLGVTGGNGCGKSTLLAVCGGLRRPDSGAVRLAGRQLYARGQRDLEHGAALLAPQFPEYMFTRPTVAAEIALDPALGASGPAEILERLRLPAAVAGRNPYELSGGQRRRLALGLVLFSGRPLLLLDEPTAGLDGPGRRLVLDLLAQVPATTVMFVASHDRAFLDDAGCTVRKLGPAGLTTP